MSEPIQAERVFRLTDTPNGWRLQSTSTGYVYQGPVASDPVPPWTADEMETVKAMHAGVDVEDEDGDVITKQYLNVPEFDLPAVLAGISPRKLSMYRERGDDALHHGFHAFRPGKLPSAYEAYPVLGEVELFGRVVEYERGFRAQGVRIKKLHLRGMPEQQIGRLISARTFSVPWQTMPQGDPAEAPRIVKDLEAAYACDVVEDWARFRTDNKGRAQQMEYYRNMAGGAIIATDGGEEGTWLTSDEKSESTKSNWMRRTLHSLGAKLQSL